MGQAADLMLDLGVDANPIGSRSAMPATVESAGTEDRYGFDR